MTDLNCLVSVILPIYNMERYLKECVQSVVLQSYRNIEIILVDDGSTDNSLKICHSLQKSDDRVMVISKQNGGVSTARNSGIEKAQGDWIMFVDPDDCLSSKIIQTLLSNISEETDIIACCCKVFDDSGLDDEDHFFVGNRTFVDDKNDLYFQLMESGYGQQGKTYTAIGVPWGKLYKRDFLIQNKLQFNTELRRVQDNLFNMYAFFYADEIKYIDEPLYNYRYEHMSDYFKKYRSNYVDLFVAVRKARYKCLVDTELINDNQIRKFYINESAVNLVGILINGIFHKKNKQRLSEKLNTAIDVCNLECFRMCFSIDKINNFKYKACIWIARKLFLFN